MELQINLDLYKRMQALKSTTNNENISDVDFLLMLVKHVEGCGLETVRDTSPGCMNGSAPEFTVGANDNGSKNCPECKFAAISAQQLWDHFDTVHTDDGHFSCTCGCSYSKLATFLRHYMGCPVAATDLQDPFCHQNSPKRPKLAPPSPLRVIAGDHCDSSCDRGSPELYHSYRHPSVSPVAGPSEDKPYGCPKCLKGFKSKSLLDQHMHLHYPPRYKCRWCGNVYRWPPVYYHHKQKCKKRPVHSGVESRQSEQRRGQAWRTPKHAMVNSTESQSQSSLTPLVNFHPLPQQPTKPSGDKFQTVVDTTSYPLTCFCNEVLPSIPLYLKHISTCPSAFPASKVFENLAFQALIPQQCLNLSTPNISKPEEQISYTAEDLSPPKEMINRSPTANGIFPCSICGKDFNSKLSLKQHVDGKHRAEGKYLCPTCGKRYRWGASFYYHKKNCTALDHSENIKTKASELLLTNT